MENKQFGNTVKSDRKSQHLQFKYCACKPRSYTTLKFQPSDWLTDSWLAYLKMGGGWGWCNVCNEAGQQSHGGQDGADDDEWYCLIRRAAHGALVNMAHSEHKARRGAHSEQWTLHTVRLTRTHFIPLITISLYCTWITTVLLHSVKAVEIWSALLCSIAQRFLGFYPSQN